MAGGGKRNVYLNSFKSLHGGLQTFVYGSLCIGPTLLLLGAFLLALSATDYDGQDREIYAKAVEAFPPALARFKSSVFVVNSGVILNSVNPVDDKVIPIPNRANYTPFYYRGEVGYQPGERFEVNIFWKKNESDTGNENGVTVIKEEIRTEETLILRPPDLKCSQNATLCKSKCDAENGTLIENSNNCQIKVYLQEICARLKWNEEEQQWTKPDLRPTQQFTADIPYYGCYFESFLTENDYNVQRRELHWEFRMGLFGLTPTPQKINVTLRSDKDPRIELSDLTDGEYAFNKNSNRFTGAGIALVVVGSVLMLSAVGMSVFCVRRVLKAGKYARFEMEGDNSSGPVLAQQDD